MNYLAHLYLGERTCGGDESIVGNLMGDFVKGPVTGQFPLKIGEAIMLHRRIDAFTDSHPSTVRARGLFSGPQRRFAGVILDICYDHFLSRNWEDFHQDPLPEFAERCYSLLQQYQSVLPVRLQHMLPRMIENRLLTSYITLAGVNLALNRIATRNERFQPLTQAVNQVELYYAHLEDAFLAFFPDLISYVDEFDKSSN